MKVLVAIPSCHKDDWTRCRAWIDGHDLTTRFTPEARREAVRQTWWNKLPYDYRFFFGRGEATQPDEVILDVPDGFSHHCDKNRAMFRWALWHGYDWVFRCDDDTFVRALEVPTYGDQVGWGPDLSVAHNYITGGAGFWISRRAMDLVVTAGCERTHEDDLWIGRDVLERSGLVRVHDPRYYPSPTHFVEPGKLPEGWLTCHSCTPEMMRHLWRTQISACA